MASVEEGAGVHARAADDNIWGSQSQSKFTRRRLIAGSVLVAAAVLGVGLYFGLKNDDSPSRTIISAQADPSAEGCFADVRSDRVMTAQFDSSTMTPAVCNSYCAGEGYFYYGVQWGKECWCAPEGVDLAKHGLGTCDFACAGDASQICGGYYAFTAYTVGTEATTPTPTPPSSSGDVSCSGTAKVRFASTISYFEGGGCATLTDMYNAQAGAEGPLYVLDTSNKITTGPPTGRWLLDKNLFVVDGVVLKIHGTSIGGDCDELRIKSTSSEYYELRGWGGSLSFMSTKVTSWDTSKGAEAKYVKNKGRSFVNCVTQYDDSDLYKCAGASDKEMGTCRMDIIDSVMGNLGWFDSESYGLTWKVRGMCKELNPDTGFPVNHDLFKNRNVYGDILNSEIYGNYYGHYTYGHQGGIWDNNKMHDNYQYGFDPHDDSDDLVISNNKVYGNVNHGIIASKRCNNVKIFNNEVSDGGPDAVGIFLHRSSDDAEVYDNYVHDMQDAGMALMEAFGAEIYGNRFENTGKYGIRFSVGAGNNNIYDNTFSGMSQYAIYTYMGSDKPDMPDNNGRPSGNVFDGNTISDAPIGVYLEEADDNTFTNNVFTSVKTFEFSDSTGTTWGSNELGGACLDGSTDFASGSIPAC